MRISVLILIPVIVFINNVLYAQPQTNDTIICIVDTTNTYVNFTKNPEKRIKKEHWSVNIDCHYYDNIPEEAELAGVSLSNLLSGDVNKAEALDIRIPVKGMQDRFQVITDSWINEQKSLSDLKWKIGIAVWHKTNYLIFNQDLLNNCGEVKAYRVRFMYGEFVA